MSQQYVLLVLREGLFSTHHLPSQGSVSLGRSVENDVSIEDPSISRHHALLHVGPPMAIEDLGSANGTRIQEALLERKPRHSASEETAKTAATDRVVGRGERIEVAPGNVLRLGAVTVVIQHAGTPGRHATLWPHAYFEARLSAMCEAAELARKPFSIVRLSTPSSSVEDVLVRHCPRNAVFAVYGPSEYELLLPDADGAASQAIARQISAQLEEPLVGIATYPIDGQSADALLACACARVGPSAPAHREPAAIVHDRAMVELYELIARVAETDIHVLIVGETGVGKEIVADRLWRVSARANKPMLRLNCAALTETLLESELFGYERGAFTGAVRSKPGLLESASGGVVFLDEVGELPLATQAKLLRVIEEHRVLRVGALRPTDIDVRFVSATHRDLEHDITTGRFREDLYYRINGFVLHVPPLRERAQEIEPLARAFMSDFCRRCRRAREPVLSREAIAVLSGYRWPGNVRELRNVVERALVLCGDGDILPEHLPIERMRPSSVATTLVPPPNAGDYDERAHIIATLEQCAGNQTKAAKLLGMSRATLVARLDRYAIPRPRK